MSVSILNRIKPFIAIFLGALCTQCGTTPSRTLPPPVETPPAETLQSGDLAFRMGRSIESEAIAAASKNSDKYSHIGVVLRVGASAHIVHIEPKRDDNERIKCEQLADFFAPEQASAGVIVRLNDLTEQQRQIIHAQCIQATQSAICFDHDYMLSDTTAMYCTELTEWIFAKADIDLSEGRRHRLPLASEAVILPCDILQRGDISIIWRFPHPSGERPPYTTDKN